MTKIVKISAELEMGEPHSPRLKKGDRVRVDAIKLAYSRSGYMVRVVGVWKKKTWLDLTWFTGLRKMD